MAVYKEKSTGFIAGDPDQPSFPDGYQSDEKARADALDKMILSPSGWRKVFAADGDEESINTEIAPVDKELVAAISSIWSNYIKKHAAAGKAVVLVALDSRYTGPVIADIIIRGLLAEGIEIRYTFITSAPECMSYARMDKDINGFIYISASHNPIGHNGIKFGLKSGGVLAGSETKKLIAEFRELIQDREAMSRIVMNINQVPAKKIKKVFKNISRFKKQSLRAYTAFSREVGSFREGKKEQKRFWSTLYRSLKINPVGILGELNGSARTVSIDKKFLSDHGLKTKFINDLPRRIVHRIVPEGESLSLCQQELEKLYQRDNDFLFGYVPDNDGDRGNIVYIDRYHGQARVLMAQEVFALACIAEISYLIYNQTLTYNAAGQSQQQQAIVVNGPTSMRIEQIAACFDIKVFRSEVGEANVVNLANEKRDQGYIVRILGEGSNGGNITFPAAVRDPLNTVFSLVKLLTLRTTSDQPGLFAIWCERSGQKDKYKSDFSIADIVKTLPLYTTTSSFAENAKVDIKTRDHAALKVNYEKIFEQEWEQRRSELKQKLNITSWEEHNYEGTRLCKGMGPSCRSGEQKGGFKIIFREANGRARAYIWMRGSGTEPVFRVAADVAGKNKDLEKYLLDWHISIIKKADQQSIS